jgi:hypothetical protein
MAEIRQSTMYEGTWLESPVSCACRRQRLPVGVEGEGLHGVRGCAYGIGTVGATAWIAPAPKYHEYRGLDSPPTWWPK